NLYDYLPAEDWCNLVEAQHIIQPNKHYRSYDEIAYLYFLYSNCKGMAAFPIYARLLDENQINNPDIPMDYYERLGFAIKGIRAVLESPSITEQDQRYIKKTVADYSLATIQGYLRPQIITLYYLAGFSFAEFCESFHDPSEQAYFQKLSRIDSFDNRSLFNTMSKQGLISEKEFKAPYGFSSYVGNCFPYNDYQLRSILDHLAVAIHLDAEIGRVPIPYDEILSDYLAPIRDQLPPFQIYFQSSKLDDGQYGYEVQLFLEETVYTVEPKDYSDYYNSQSIRDLINVVLFDQNMDFQLIELMTNDQSSFHIYANPVKLANLYATYELGLEMQ
ncbi:MAG: hypothetical protein AAGD05_13885, partial [Bacteroidota bacterium]